MKLAIDLPKAAVGGFCGRYGCRARRDGTVRWMSRSKALPLFSTTDLYVNRRCSVAYRQWYEYHGHKAKRRCWRQ